MEQQSAHLRAATWVVGTAMMRREHAACSSRSAFGVRACPNHTACHMRILPCPICASQLVDDPRSMQDVSRAQNTHAGGVSEV